MNATSESRYARQMRLPEIGVDGQARLAHASVLLIGAGGLGSPAALYLAASGVGRIGLIDADRVDRSNLHRQVLYGEADIGRPKVEAARQRLTGLNPEIEIVPHPEWFGADNARGLISAYDLVLDGSDSFETRYLVNDACVLEGIPCVSASVSSFEGQLLTILPGGGPCYRCVFPAPPPATLAPNCAEAGVLGVTPGLLGVLQATEALKLFLDIGEPLIGRLLLADTLTMRFRRIEVERDPECPVCSASGEIRSMDDSLRATQDICRLPTDDMKPEISPRSLKELLDTGENVTLIDVRNANEHAFTDMGGMLVPLPELSNRYDELEPFKTSKLVVYCRSGGRSSVAVSMLRARGFDATSLAGGILAWGDDIDPSIQRY